MVGDPVAEGGAALGRREALSGRQQVLDADGHAAQWPRIAGADGVRLGERPLAAHEDERGQLGVQAVDRIQRGLHELTRRHPARPHQGGLVDSTEVENIPFELHLRGDITDRCVQAEPRWARRAEPQAHARDRSRGLEDRPQRHMQTRGRAVGRSGCRSGRRRAWVRRSVRGAVMAVAVTGTSGYWSSRAASRSRSRWTRCITLSSITPSFRSVRSAACSAARSSRVTRW